MRAALSLAALAFVAASALAIASAASLTTTSLPVTTASVAATVPSSSCTLAAAADTYADQMNLLTNYGGAATLDVLSSQLALVPMNKRSFVRFDLTSCSLPGGARITAADLSLWLGTPPVSTRTYDVSRVTAAWTETDVTWSAQPATAATATASFATASGTRTADVVADVRSFLSGTANYGWRIADHTENSATGYEGRFASREAGSQGPSLVLTYYP